VWIPKEFPHGTSVKCASSVAEDAGRDCPACWDGVSEGLGEHGTAPAVLFRKAVETKANLLLRLVPRSIRQIGQEGLRRPLRLKSDEHAHGGCVPRRIDVPGNLDAALLGAPCDFHVRFGLRQPKRRQCRCTQRDQPFGRRGSLLKPATAKLAGECVNALEVGVAPRKPTQVGQ
jgi:hypothetical protein